MLKMGLIGVGAWGPNIARSIEQSGRAQLRWVCDLDVKRLDLVKQRLPSVQTTQSIDDVLGDAEVGAVAIATPVHSHTPLVKRALGLGKHVLVEKPITPNGAEGLELIAAAEAAGKQLMVGHVFEYNASILALKRLIDDGELGDVHYLSFVRTNLGPVRTDVNAFWDLASHDVSIMNFFFGCAPLEVTARGHDWLNEGIEDTVFATFTLPKNVLAHVNVSWLNPRKVRRITVVGSKKMAVWDDLDMQRPIQVFDRHVEMPNYADNYHDFKTVTIDGGIYIPNIRLNQPLQAEVEHFIDCVLEGRTPQSDGLSGLRVVRSLEAASESMRNGCALTPVVQD